jgi:subtilisin-like proprotein convertase family protein
MNFYFYKRLFLFISFSLIVSNGSFAFNTNDCVDCSPVIYTGTIDIHADSVRVTWFDFSSDPVEWELEVGLAGFIPLGQPNVTAAKIQAYTFQSLIPGSAYHFYVRTICESGMSDWAGPFFFRTHFISPSECQSNIEIKDDNCNISNIFGIEVQGYDDKILGTDLFISEINLIIEHSFPSDLEISIASPVGMEVSLSKRNGIASDHYGDPTDETCESVVTFSMSACESILEGPKPYIGSYKPEGDLNSFHNGSVANGIWNLKICDIAPGDFGIIKYVEIVFSETLCQLPQEIFINGIQDDGAIINWSTFESCETLTIEYGESGFESGSGTTIQVPCDDLSTPIMGLSPGLDYEIKMQSNCGVNNSPTSCRIGFTTSCHPVSIIENFDSQNECEPICGNQCPLNGLWINSELDSYDWIINSGSTPTDFTGPLSDLNGHGNYIYLESFATDCNINRPAILESNCFQIVPNEDGCDMSFYYHMNGIEVNRLTLEISTDNGQNWDQIWNKSGDQGNEWAQAIIDLGIYSGILSKFRFIGYGAFGSFGDIALDNIEFYGSIPVTEEAITYYLDEDNDGFGNSDFVTYLCFASPPEGFSFVGGDCDDTNENINPEANEIPCNLIDENCNGLEDDPVQNNPLGSNLIQLSHENCGESFDGLIKLSGSGGTPPYTFQWNIEKSGATLDSLTAGVYFCTIEDATGCKTISDFYEINTVNDISLFITQLNNPDCIGAQNGLISVNQSGGTTPYSYEWNNGDSMSMIENLGVGSYVVTVTDANQCVLVSNPIILTPKDIIEVSVQNSINVSCNGFSDGQILLNMGSGRPPFDFNWSNGDSLLLANNLIEGTYSCTVIDADGCTGIIENIIIEEPDELTIRLDAVDNNICFEGKEGSIKTSIFGGTPPFSFSWSNGDFTDDIFNLEVGLYSLTVTDKEFCSTEISDIEIGQPDPISITIDSIKNVNCLLSTDGYIAVNVNGGIPPYQYFWDYPGSDTSYIDKLPVGDYRLTVLDVFACKQILEGIQISNRDIPLEVGIVKEEEILCAGDSTGLIAAYTNTGKAPYDFNWSAGKRNIKQQSIDSLSLIPSGSYKVTITDSEGCVGVTEEVTLEDPSELNYDLVQLTNLKCYNDNDGTIDIEVEGGVKPYKYSWSNEMMTEDIDALSAGIYTLTISDYNDCILVTQEFQIHEPAKISLNTTSESAINNADNGSATVSASGGSPPFFYSWDENTGSQASKTATGLFPGEYFVTITDSRDCIADTSVIVDNITSSKDLELIKIFEIFPNPAQNRFSVNLELAKNMEFEVGIYNVYGLKLEQISKISSSDLHSEIDVASYTSGLYYIVFKTGKYRSVKKLILIK